MNQPRSFEHDWFASPPPASLEIGDSSWCYSSFAFLHNRCTKPGAIKIGEHTGIYNGSFFDLGPDASVVIGNYCTLVGAILSTNRVVTMGDYCFIAHEVVIADSPAAQPAPGAVAPGAIVLEQNCWVGMRAMIIGPVRIGEGAIVGAYAVVTGEVPPYAIVAGNPARVVGWSKRTGKR